MKRNLWALGLALAAVPFLAAILLRQLEYSEFKRAIAERRLRNTHARQMRQLAKLQTKMALEIENELVRHIHDYSKKGPSIFTALQDKIFALIDLHSTELALPALDDQTIAALTWARDDKHFAAAITPYVELRQLHEDAAAVMAAATPDARLEAEKNFTDSMENIASDMRLVSIIAGDERLTPAYNGLVDAYLMISALHQTVEENAGKELQLEGSFLKDLQGIFDRKELVEQHQSDHQWVRIYNLLVELHDHYVRKQEMNES